MCSDTTNCVSQHIFYPFFSFRALSCRLRGNWLTGSTGKEKDHRKLQNLISKLLWNLCTDEMHFLERKTWAILQRSWESGSSTGSFSLTKNSSKHKPYKLSLANDVLMQVKLEEVPDPALQKSRPRWIRARTTGRCSTSRAYTFGSKSVTNFETDGKRRVSGAASNALSSPMSRRWSVRAFATVSSHDYEERV